MMRSYVSIPPFRLARFTRGLGLCLTLALSCVGRPGLASANSDTCVGAHEQAQVDRIAGRYLAARTALLTCAQRACPRLISDECNTWLGELERVLPSVVFAVTDELGHDLVDVHLSLNDATATTPVDGRALALDPGLYKLRVEAAGHAAVEQSLSIRDGEKNRLVRVTLPRLSAPRVGAPAESAPTRAASTPPSPAGATASDVRARRLRFASYALGTASVAGFVITLASGARGFRMLQHCQHDGCSDSYVDHGKSLYRAADLSAITGGVFLAAAAGTLWGALRQAGQRDTQTQRERGVAAYADNHGAALTAWSRW